MGAIQQSINQALGTAAAVKNVENIGLKQAQESISELGVNYQTQIDQNTENKAKKAQLLQDRKTINETLKGETPNQAELQLAKEMKASISKDLKPINKGIKEFESSDAAKYQQDVKSMKDKYPKWTDEEISKKVLENAFYEQQGQSRLFTNFKLGIEALRNKVGG